MPDWLIKIFAPIISIKTAAIALLTCIGLTTLWTKAVQLITNNGTPEIYAPFILAVIAYSFSHLLVEGVIKAYQVLGRLKAKNKEKRESLNHQKTFEILIEKTIPHLPHDQFQTLEALLKSSQTLDIKKNNVRCLERAKYIERGHKVSPTEFIYKISPTVKAPLTAYLASERKSMLEAFIVNLTADEKHFLELFFCEVLTEGSPESGVMMKHCIFRAGESMSHRKLLVHFEKTSDGLSKESFRLFPDTSEYLQKNIFNQEPIRTELRLDSNYIAGTNASGGGALGDFR